MKYKKYYLDLNVYCDGKNIGPNNWDGKVTVGFKINGVDQGYIRDYYQQVVYGTTWEIYGVNMNGFTRSYSASGTVTAATAANVTVGKMSFSSNNTSYGSVSASEYIVLSGTTYTTNNRTLTLSDGRSVMASVSDVTGHTTTFTGWSSANGTVNRSVGITANFSRSINTYTVTIARNNTNYGTVSSSSVTNVPYGTTYSTNGSTLTFSNGTTVTASATSATGYTTTFSSWSSTSGTITGATTITANFNRSAITYTVSYDANGGTGAPTAQTKTYGVNLTLSSTVPTKPHYTFKGWKASSGTATAVYSAGGTYTNNESVTLKADWEVAHTDSCYHHHTSGCYSPKTSPWPGPIKLKERSDPNAITYEQTGTYTIPADGFYCFGGNCLNTDTVTRKVRLRVWYRFEGMSDWIIWEDKSWNVRSWRKI